MINEYDTNFFTVKDLNMIPNSWGRSIGSMSNIFDLYKEIDINNSNITENNFIDDNKNTISKYTVGDNKNADKQLFINLDNGTYGKDADFIYLDLETYKTSGKNDYITIYWENKDNSFSEARSFKCNVGDGKLLIPLGIHPGWLLSENKRIAISFNECNPNMTFSVNKIQLLNLREN